MRRAAPADREPVALRIANAGPGSVVLDLANPDGRCVVVDAGGWHVVERSPVLFRRTPLTGPLPVPVRGGTLAPLAELLNVDEARFRLIVAWIVSALFPAIPHPILALVGEQGTAKTTAGRLVMSLVDSSPAAVRTPPKEMRSWAAMAAASWVVFIDNVSSIPAWFSDTLCKAVTGDGIVKRALHTDDDINMAADRRLTAGGQLVEDESNKVALLLTRDARLLVGYTGLAGDHLVQGIGPAPRGRFKTSYWILDTLLSVAGPDHLAEPMIERFAERAEQTMNGLRVRAAGRGLLVGFTGYTYGGGGPVIFHRSVTNFVNGSPQVGQRFAVEEAPDGRPLAKRFALAYGSVDTVAGADVAALQDLLREERPPRALVGKAVEVMRDSAARSNGRVGTQLSTAVLPADPRGEATVEYHSGHNTNTIYGIGQIDARGEPYVPAVTGEIRIVAGGPGPASTPVISVAKVERNAPCPCRSGRKYKHCHGR